MGFGRGASFMRTPNTADQPVASQSGLRPSARRRHKCRPLRFCMLTTFYPPWSFGGDAIQVQRLSEALAERGHEVTVVHSLEAYRALSRDRPAVRTTAGV